MNGWARRCCSRPRNALIAAALMLAGGCTTTGGDAVRELGKAGATTIAATQSSLDTATQGMQAGLQRHCQRLDGATAEPADPAGVETSLAELGAVQESRHNALSRLRQTYLAFREIEDKGEPLAFEQAAGGAEHSLEHWRAAVTGFSGPVSDREPAPLPAVERSLWRPLRVMMLGEPVQPDTRQASERLRRMLLATSSILETERTGVVSLQRATSQLRLSNDLALWRADQLDLGPLAVHEAGDKPQFLREAARRQIKPGTARGRQLAERRLAEYLDDEDRALIAVYDAASKALAQLQAAHVALAGAADLNLSGVKRSVEQLARATRTFEAAP
jgi:hypothetical protein